MSLLPVTRRRQVRTFSVEAVCDPPCLGTRHAIGIDPNNPHRVLHRCTECGKDVVFSEAYPKIETEFVDEPAKPSLIVR